MAQHWQRQKITQIFIQNYKKFGYLSLESLATWDIKVRKTNGLLINVKKQYDPKLKSNEERQGERMTPLEQKTQADKLLAFLNNEKRRCTYKAFGGVLGIFQRCVSTQLFGEQDPYLSWVVNSKTGKPSNYEPQNLHPELYTNEYIIRDEEELRALAEHYWREQPNGS